MRKLIVVVCMLAALAAGARAASKTYELRAVTSPADVSACVAAGGRGALVFDLDSDGDMASDPAPYCVVESK